MVEGARFRQFPVAVSFSMREQVRNRFAVLLLVAFVPAWYALMVVIVPHTPLHFRLYSTHRVLAVDGRHLALITAGLNALTLIVGFMVFAAVRRALEFDRRLISCGYRQAAIVGAKAIALVAVAVVVAACATAVLSAYWQPGLDSIGAIGLAFGVVAIEYGTLGLLLGVTVRGDLEGFFLIIMVSLVDTFLQNPLQNPLANKPALQYLPSFGPMQFASAGSFAHQALYVDLAVGMVWSAAFLLVALGTFTARTRRSLVAWRMGHIGSVPLLRAPNKASQ